MRTLLLLTLSLFSFVYAQQYAGDDFRKMRFGVHIAGELFNLKQAENYVTIVHMFGISEKLQSGSSQRNSVGSMASKSSDEMKRLNNTYKKYHQNGLMVIGSFVNTQDIADEINVAQFALKARVNYPVAMGSTHPIKLDTLPYTFVYDVKGKLISHGENVQPQIKAALDLLPNYEKNIIGDNELRYFRNDAKKMISGRSLGSVYKKLDKIAKEDKKEDKKEEANYLLGKLNFLLVQKKLEFVIFERTAPSFFLEESEKFIRNWDGHPEIEEFEKYIKTLKNEKPYQNLLKGEKYYQVAKNTFYSLRALGDKDFVDFKDPKVVRKNSSTISRLKQYCELLQKDFVGTEYAKWAATTLKSLE